MPKLTQAAISAAFTGACPRRTTSFAYRFALLAIAVVMLLLPAIYLLLIVALLGGVVAYATYGVEVLQEARGIIGVTIYLGPIAAGLIAVFFMFKPLLASSASDDRSRTLTREGEPLLFAFVDEICDRLQAPRPRSIQVISDINAAAGFRRGLWSMIVGNDLVLVIGMPLVAALDARQFAAVLAHEFGHFRQGGGMRMSYVMRFVNLWFVRVVWQRDKWDERLDALCRRVHISVFITVVIAKVCVWLSRCVLGILMRLGFVVSGYMSRQMEFDADACSAAVCGSQVVERNFRRLVLLTMANERAMRDLYTFHSEGRLGDNLPRILMAAIARAPHNVDSLIDAKIEESKTHWFDTHPCEKDRIAAVQALARPGVFHLEVPATALFHDFESLARNCTWDFYRWLFGPNFKREAMHPTEDLLQRRAAATKEADAAARFFLGDLLTLRHLPLGSYSLTEKPVAGELQAELVAARETMAEMRHAYQEAAHALDQADDDRQEAEVTQALLKAQVRVKAAATRLKMIRMGDVKRAFGSTGEVFERAGWQMAPFEEAATRRIRLAIYALHDDRLQARLPEASLLAEESGKLLAAMELIGRWLGELLQARNALATINALLRQVTLRGDNRAIVQQIVNRQRPFAMRLCELRKHLASELYPLDHAKGELSIADYALEKLPPLDDLGAVLSAASEMLNKLDMLYRRGLERLAWIAEHVETALGLPPLPQPSDEQAAETA